MNSFSFSRVELFESCPGHFKLRYIDEYTEIPNLKSDNPLILGSAMHIGIEKGVAVGLKEYFDSFPVLNDKVINESIKLKLLMPRVHEWLADTFPDCELIHEYAIEDDDGYKGFIDLIVVAPDGTCCIVDFKYSNQIEKYKKSSQLHIYADRLIKRGFKVSKLAYLFIPKVAIKQKKTEDLFQFRNRIVKEVNKSELTFITIDYDEMQPVYFINSVSKMNGSKEYPFNVNEDCYSCMPRFKPNYLEVIENEKGEIEMALPKNERRERQIDTKPDLWIYGDSYIGKSTFADGFENVVMANTDGNTDNTTAPVIPIKDIVTKDGRRTNRKLAWEVFLEMIHDLEMEKNEFDTVVIDLIEDLKEHCRIYVFEKNAWEHESDGGYGKGWDRVKTEWQRAIKRLKSLGYQLIYISKEKRKDITLSGGGTRTTYSPNIDETFANFLTGTVDLTVRAFASGEDRLLQLGKKGTVFGGGRFNFKSETCALDIDEFIEELKDAQRDVAKRTKSKSKRTESSEEVTEEEVAEEKTTRRKREKVEEEQPKERSRKKRDEVESDPVETDEQEEVAAGEEPEVPEEKTRSRKSRKSNEEVVEESAPRERKRREREVDETPPGEESDEQSEEVKEKSSSRRSRRQ